MNVDGTPYRTIWIDPADRLLVIDQRALPHVFAVVELASPEEVCAAIRNMTVRGAGLIGATAGYGMWLAARTLLRTTPGITPDAFDAAMERAAAALLATRPTAGNLARAVERQRRALALVSSRHGGTDGKAEAKLAAARRTAEAIADEDAAFCRRIGEHGRELIRRVAEGKKPGEPVRILTHCNAGWLAFVDYGSALAPVYAAFAEGVPVHVWVDETRPRNQGASLTAWELARQGVPHALIADNAGGHLMQHGLVDLVITGADRVTRQGDTANKIGTYLKALAARDNKVPFYVALPSTTFDPSLRNGLEDIPIEERDADEVRVIRGRTSLGSVIDARICPEETPARNWAFDVTPARLLTGFICERGICAASEEGILNLFPEWRDHPAAGGDERPDEGVVKYAATHTFASLPLGGDLSRTLSALDAARTFLHERGLIGADEKGTGFGNISALLPPVFGADRTPRFLISGSATGKARVLGADGYSLVSACDAGKNAVTSSGPVRASSESLTHDAVYRANSRARFVIHAHHHGLFAALRKEGWPHTPSSAAYGTPAMARAVEALMRDLPESEGLFVSAGHADGLFAYGEDLARTVNVFMRLLARVGGKDMCCYRPSSDAEAPAETQGEKK